jgi:putative ABC transport system ATP-binding protein
MSRERGDAHADPMHELRSFLATYRADIVTVGLYAACVGLFALATPIAVQAVVSTLEFGTVLQPLVVLVVLLLSCLSFASVIKALKAWVVEMLQRRMFLHTVAAAAYRLPRADVALLRAPGRTQLVHRFFELFAVQKATASLLLSRIDVVLAGSVGMLVLAFYHPVLLAFDVALILCLLTVVFLLGRGGLPSSIEEFTYKYEMAAFLTELARSGYVFRDPGGAAYANERIDELASKYLHARAAHFSIVLRQIIGALVTQVLASGGLLALGGWLVIERELTLGQLVAAEPIVTSVASTMTDLGKHIETYYDLVTGLHKLEALTAPIERGRRRRAPRCATGGSGRAGLLRPYRG